MIGSIGNFLLVVLYIDLYLTLSFETTKIIFWIDSKKFFFFPRKAPKVSCCLETDFELDMKF